jgi:Tfp pilus assembly protein PilX
MTTAHVEKFAELVAKDPALLAKLGLDKVNADAAAAVASAEASVASAEAFITNAVKEAKALGLEFTEEEASAFMAAEQKAAASGELSDTQLEAVAGGKTNPGRMNANHLDRIYQMMGGKYSKGGNGRIW